MNLILRFQRLVSGHPGYDTRGELKSGFVIEGKICLALHDVLP